MLLPYLVHTAPHQRRLDQQRSLQRHAPRIGLRSADQALEHRILQRHTHALHHAASYSIVLHGAALVLKEN
jgi:hypothetical protein